MKYFDRPPLCTKYPVAPHAGAWIEIIKEIPTKIGQFVAPHAGAWIEIMIL